MEEKHRSVKNLPADTSKAKPGSLYIGSSVNFPIYKCVTRQTHKAGFRSLVKSYRLAAKRRRVCMLWPT